MPLPKAWYWGTRGLAARHHPARRLKLAGLHHVVGGAAAARRGEGLPARHGSGLPLIVFSSLCRLQMKATLLLLGLVLATPAAQGEACMQRRRPRAGSAPTPVRCRRHYTSVSVSLRLYPAAQNTTPLLLHLVTYFYPGPCCSPAVQQMLRSVLPAACMCAVCCHHCASAGCCGDPVHV